MRPLVIAILVWLALIALASIYGGYMSFFTGKASELPKWNGWSYLWFCAKEGAMFGFILTWPIAVLVFVGAWIALLPQDTD